MTAIRFIAFTAAGRVRTIHSTAAPSCPQRSEDLDYLERVTMKHVKASVGIVINGMGLIVLLSHLGQWHAG